MDPTLSAELVDGSGTPLVFVHGWLGSKASWRQVRDHLALDNPMLFYDQRCHGDSPCEEFDFDGLADDLHALVQEHGFEEPVLVGHSMGGMVALTYAVRYSDISGLFLLGTCASTPEPAIESPAFFLDTFGEMDRREWAETMVDNYVHETTPETVREETVQQVMDAGDIPVNDGLRAMIDYDVRESLEEISLPSRVIGGAHDQAITPDKIEELARLLGCDTEFLDASHLLLQEVPGDVADMLEQFVARHQ